MPFSSFSLLSLTQKAYCFEDLKIYLEFVHPFVNLPFRYFRYQMMTKMKASNNGLKASNMHYDNINMQNYSNRSQNVFI